MTISAPPFACSVVVLTLLLSFAISSEAQFLEENNVCRIATFIPFQDLRDGPPEDHADADFRKGESSYGYGTWPNRETLAGASFSLLVASEMARTHFNTRNSVLVPELQHLLGDCKITLADPAPASASIESAKEDGSIRWYIDSAHDRRYATREFLRPGYQDSTICAVVGPADDFVAQGLSTITEGLDIPQIAYQTIGYRLSRMKEFPTFARVIPEAYDFGATIAKFFQRDMFQRDVAGIIYDNTDYGEQFESPIEEAEDDYDYLTITEGFDQGDDESIESALQEALDKGFRTIVLITDQVAVLDDVARVADSMGMLGDGYFWILSGGAIPPGLWEEVKYEVDSPADRMLRGAALFTNFDNFMYYGDKDPFLTEWRKKDDILLNQATGSQPIDPSSGLPFYTPSAFYFEAVTPTIYASFMYDAVMMAGISACRANAEGNTGTENNHVASVFNTSFHGASGWVEFKEGEDMNGNSIRLNSREASDLTFGMYNIRPGSISDENLQSYEFVLTHLYGNQNTFINEDGENEPGAWKAVDSTEFLFFDGTTNEPMPKRETANAHFISRGIYIIGLMLSTLAFVISATTGLWVFMTSQHRIIKASQPEFLYLLCLGAAIVAPSPFFVGFDEDKGVTKRQLDPMCAAFPWSFVIGYLIMYCALFSKLWRLSRLMEFRRKVVTVRNVLLPFVLVMVCSLLVLVAWEIVGPLEWERQVISEGEEPYETYGECTSSIMLPFIIPLVILMFAVVVATAIFAWKLREVQSELSESRWIFGGIFLHIQTWLIGLPTWYITNGISKDAGYLMIVILAFTFSTSHVVLVIWPKGWAIRNIQANATNASAGASTRPVRQTMPQISFRGTRQTHISGLGSTHVADDNSNMSSFRKLAKNQVSSRGIGMGPGTGHQQSMSDTQSNNMSQGVNNNNPEENPRDGIESDDNGIGSENNPDEI